MNALSKDSARNSARRQATKRVRPSDYIRRMWPIRAHSSSLI